MTDRPIHDWFRRAIGLRPVVSGDSWHRQTTPPRVDDNAEWYAYDRLALPFNSIYGNGNVTFANYEAFGPILPGVQVGPQHGLGGVRAGSSLTDRLLVSQADAVRRGLTGPGNG